MSDEPQAPPEPQDLSPSDPPPEMKPAPPVPSGPAYEPMPTDHETAGRTPGEHK
jgi:hypothetical protein